MPLWVTLELNLKKLKKMIIIQDFPKQIVTRFQTTSDAAKNTDAYSCFPNIYLVTTKLYVFRLKILVHKIYQKA